MLKKLFGKKQKPKSMTIEDLLKILRGYSTRFNGLDSNVLIDGKPVKKFSHYQDKNKNAVWFNMESE
jgi:hypothetical protein